MKVPRRQVLRSAVLTAGGLLLNACERAAPSRTPTPAPTATPAPSATPTRVSTQTPTPPSFAERAAESFALLKRQFATDDGLFREHSIDLPGDRSVAYVWPYSAVMSAVNALAALPAGEAYHADLRAVLDGVEAYFDPKGDTPGYDSYIQAGGGGQKYYDDNEWIGLEFIDGYRRLGEARYLEQAIVTWRFALSGWSDDRLGGGIFWRQFDWRTKNTCSNAPGALLALELYRETQDQAYLDWAVRILDWTRQLKAPENVYWDHIRTEDEVIDKATFTYNTGTPLHANVLLYTLTGEDHCLKEAQALAVGSLAHFAPVNETGQRFFPATPWFNAVLLRAYLALYAVDGDRTYLQAMAANLDHAWLRARGPDGAFSPDWTGTAGVDAPARALLDQAAMVELFARLSQVVDYPTT